MEINHQVPSLKDGTQQVSRKNDMRERTSELVLVSILVKMHVIVSN